MEIYIPEDLKVKDLQKIVLSVLRSKEYKKVKFDVTRSVLSVEEWLIWRDIM